MAKRKTLMSSQKRSTQRAQQTPAKNQSQRAETVEEARTQEPDRQRVGTKNWGRSTVLQRGKAVGKGQISSPGTATRKPHQTSTRQQKRRLARATSPWRVWGPVGGTVVAIALIVGLFFLLARQQTGGTASGTVPQRPLASSTIMQSVTSIDPTVFATVGGGSTTPPSAVSGHPLLTGSGGKPLIFYAGAEYCPYCAAERWGVVVALSRFGTWSNLHETTSSAGDVYPSTNTFSFYQSTYQSASLDFLSLEETTNQPDSNGGYVPLQSPTAQEQQLLSTFNPPGIPFIDIANKFTVTTPGYSPQALQGMSWDGIASVLSDPNSPVTQGIVGTANYLTAAICEVTNQQPSSVCTAAPIPQLERSLNGTGASNTVTNAAIASASHALEPVDVPGSRQRYLV